jgi:type II secretory pathway predicted ATPase ExeA
MYHAHFGLQKGLFGDGIAADTAVFRSPKHDQVIAHFKLALGSPSAALVLRGPAGIGKTTLTAATLRASSTRLAMAWLNGMPTNATELLELVLVELGVSTLRTTRMERLQLWRQFQAESRATESRLFIVVERTEDVSPDVLHALDQLTAPDAVGNPGANVVLLGHSTIDEHLAAPLLESLRQRIRVRTDLTPFTEAELQDYLRHQVACAGGHYDRIFAPGTVAALQRYTGGVARLANTLCETALDLAASQQQKVLTPELVTKTAVAVLRLAETGSVMRVAPAEPSSKTPPVAETRPTAVVAVAPFAPPIAPAETPAIAPTIATVIPAIAAPIEASPAPVALVPVIAQVPAVTPTPSARPAQVPAPVMTAGKQQPVDFEFDGGATDITDVAMADFPVLTDAVEPEVAAAPAKRPAPVPPQAQPVPVAAPAVKPVPTPRAADPVAPKPFVPAMSRVETAYTSGKSTPPPAPKPPAPPAAAATPKPAAPLRTPTVDPADDDDLLRQTQTMRAISVAKSIDDISSSMAETLFGDAELDLITAAMASAAEWPDDDDVQPAAAPSKPEPAKAAAPADDPWDLFGLGDDAPLELIDDSAQSPADRKSASR